MMVENKTGLIINVSSPGGLRYLVRLLTWTFLILFELESEYNFKFSKVFEMILDLQLQNLQVKMNQNLNQY